LVAGRNGDHSEIGFAFLLFDLVDLFPFPEVRIMKFLSKCSHPKKGVSTYSMMMLVMKCGDEG